MAARSPGKPHLWSRNGLALEPKFPTIAKAISKLKLRSTILDGEVVAVPKTRASTHQFPAQPAERTPQKRRNHSAEKAP
jgi:ATP-dependent DNA ligase